MPLVVSESLSLFANVVEPLVSTRDVSREVQNTVSTTSVVFPVVVPLAA